MKIENSIRVKHQDLLERYSLLQKEVNDLFSESCSTNEWFFEQRLKSEESYALKLATGRYPGFEIDDFYACTIVVPNLRYITDAEDLVLSCFEIIDKKPGETIKSKPSDFSFNSIRISCKKKKGIQENYLDNCVFEVQIKTLLEHACSKATHDFSYKGGNVSWSRERLATQIKAVLDNVDLSIMEMERLSSSSALDRKHDTYERLKEIVGYIDCEWGSLADDLVPGDVKRLAEVTMKMLSVSNLGLGSLKGAVEKETAEGRGKNTKNQSLYSIFLQSLLNQEQEHIMKYLTGKKQRYKQQILITPEIELPEGLDIKSLKNAVFLSNESM